MRRVDLDRLAELEEEQRFLLRSLDDLDREREAGDVDETDYRTLRDGYTARAAAVIREIEAGRAALPARPPVRWGRLAAAVAGALAVAALAGWLVARSSGQDVPEAASGQSPEDRVAELLAGGRQLIGESPLEALQAFGEVLRVDPGNVEALTYAGWTARLAAQGAAEGPPRDQLIQLAADKLREAIAADPTYPDAQCFYAVVEFRDLGDAAAAKPALDACLAANPPAVVRAAVESLGADIDAAVASGG